MSASETYIDRRLSISTMRRMAKTELSIKVGRAIRTVRKQRNLVMREIAEHFGIHVAAVGNWESGANLPKTENLIRLGSFLKVDPSALGRGDVVYLDDSPRSDAEIITDMQPLDRSAFDVEKLGIAAGGHDGFTFNGEIAGYVRRPPGIAKEPRVFAVEIISESMVPRYEPGEVIYCDAKPPQIGDYVVIEMFPADKTGNGMAFVKRLKKRTKTTILVEQFNPPSEITFDPYEIKHLWRIVPSKELHGY